MKKPVHITVKKAAVWAVIINTLEILAALALLVLAVFFPSGLSQRAETVLLILLTGIVVWGAAVDIREALFAGRLSRRFRGLDRTVTEMSDFNRALRAQRHDFMGHLQVVSSLLEMEEYADAKEYISKVSGDVRSLSTFMRTACVPVNALLRAKSAECGAKGISLTVEARASWDKLPLPGWEMCRVLGNLIDNAADALAGRSDARITVTLTESEKECAFTVENNGPDIPKGLLGTLFEAGVSSKGKGRGMGLYISKKILQDAGGTLTCESENGTTRFSGRVPKAAEGVTTQG